MLHIGCHLSSSKGFAAMGRTALELGADTFQFFTRNPRGSKAAAIDPKDAAALVELMKTHRFAPVIAHAPYTLNLCGAAAENRAFARETMADDLRRLEFLPGQYYNFHPGSHVGQGTEAGIAYIAEALNAVLRPEQTTTVLLETMTGKGSVVGGRFEELREILDRVELTEKMGVCLDTCHVSDGGYDIVGDLDGVLTEFDRIIGLHRLKAIHLNDSKNPAGARKDRHECVGKGHIGLEAIARIVRHPALKGLPFCLKHPTNCPATRRRSPCCGD